MKLMLTDIQRIVHTSNIAALHNNGKCRIGFRKYLNTIADFRIVAFFGNMNIILTIRACQRMNIRRVRTIWSLQFNTLCLAEFIRTAFHDKYRSALIPAKNTDLCIGNRLCGFLHGFNHDISCSDSITSFTAYAANARGIGSIACLYKRESQKYFLTMIFL